MKFILARHGRSVYNEKGLLTGRKDIELSEKGHEQSQAMCTELEKYWLNVIVVSPLIRARQSIQPYLDRHPDIRVITSDLITEIETGDYNGKPEGTMKEYVEGNNLDPITFKPPNGESISEVYIRAIDFLRFIQGLYKTGTILVVSHHSFLTCLEILLTNSDIKDYFSRATIKNGEIRVFEIQDIE